MQEAGALTGEASPFGNLEGFREKAWASLASTGGMFLVPCAYLALETYGPSSQVVFYDYLPFQDARNFVLAATLGAWLGTWCFRLLRSGRHYSSTMVIVGCLLGGALGLIAAGFLVMGTLHATGIHPIVLMVIAAFIPGVGAWWCGVVMFKSTQPTKRVRLGWLPLSIAGTVAVWLIYPQFVAFPKHGTLAEREAWAQHNIRQYMSLTRTIKNIPLIRESVGPVTAIAPASGQQHITAQTMDGVEMNIVLDVVGDRGGGILHVRCTVDGDVVFDWQPATWTMYGLTTEISTVPNLLRR
jgi:hypothetical protein